MALLKFSIYECQINGKVENDKTFCLFMKTFLPISSNNQEKTITVNIFFALKLTGVSFHVEILNNYNCEFGALIKMSEIFFIYKAII